MPCIGGGLGAGYSLHGTLSCMGPLQKMLVPKERRGFEVFEDDVTAPLDKVDDSAMTLLSPRRQPMTTTMEERSNSVGEGEDMMEFLVDMSGGISMKPETLDIDKNPATVGAESISSEVLAEPPSSSQPLLSPSKPPTRGQRRVSTFLTEGMRKLSFKSHGNKEKIMEGRRSTKDGAGGKPMSTLRQQQPKTIGSRKPTRSGVTMLRIARRKNGAFPTSKSKKLQQHKSPTMISEQLVKRCQSGPAEF